MPWPAYNMSRLIIIAQMKATLQLTGWTWLGFITLSAACPHLRQMESASAGSITYVCDGVCGGVADRVRGIGALYMFALITNRTFHIRAPHMHLLPREVPWDAPSHPTAHFSAIDQIGSLRPCDWPPHVSVATNQWDLAMVTDAECLRHDARSQRLARAFFEAPPSARDYVRAYPCLGRVFKRLFTPTRALANAVRAAMPGPGTVGIHVRAGDDAMLHEGQPRPNVRLAPCLSAARAWRLPIVYVVSDSPAIKREAATAGLQVSPQPPYHVDHQAYDAQRFMGVMVDLLTLASLDAIVLTPSGFGALAALIGEYRPDAIAYC